MSQPQLYQRPPKPGYLGGYNWPAVIVGLLVLVIANFFCTQYIANRFQYQAALGPPMLRLRAGAIYQPFAWAKWGWEHLTEQDPAIRMPFLLGMLVLVAGCFLSIGVFFAMTNRRARLLSMNAEHLHGSARWAEESDIKASGLLTANSGVFVGGCRRKASACITCGTTAPNISWPSRPPAAAKAWSSSRCIHRRAFLSPAASTLQPGTANERWRASRVATTMPENTVGTVQSIEHTLRSLERVAIQQQERADHLQKTLTDYQAQANRPFEHEARLKELLVRQEQINALLDLDKGERQIAEAARDRDDLTIPSQTMEISATPVIEHSALSAAKNGAQKPSENGQADLARSAIECMRDSGMAIADMAISERTVPNAGIVSGTAVAIDGTRVAVATAGNRFMVLELDGSGGDVAVGADVRIRFNRGRATVESPERERGR